MNQEIPDGWNKVKFKELAKQKSVRIDNPGESGFEKYVGLEHLDSGELVVKRYGSTSDVTSTMKLFNKGDILFARRNTYLRRVSVVPFDGVCSGDIIVLEPILDHIVEGFLPIFMQFEQFENKIIALSAGAFSKRIKWKQLAEEDICIPSIEEQKKISEVLWSIEENAEKNESLISTVEALKQGLFSELLTKGIWHKKFKETEIGNIPDEWDFCVFTDVINVNPSRKMTKGKISPFVAMADVIEYQEKIQNISKRVYKGGGAKFTNGDTLLARITPCLENGKTSYVDVLDEGDLGFGSTEFIVLSGKKHTTLSKYVYYIATSPFFRKIAISSMSGTTGRQRVPNDFFDMINIGIPPIEEQKEIIDIFETLNESILKYNNQLTCLFNLKKKLTNDYLSGKLLIPKEVL